MNENTDQPILPEAELDGVMRRVQKLLAIAQDTRANPAEAAAAAAMAEKVMRKHQLDHADVIAAQLKRDKGAIVAVNVFGNMKRDVPNRPSLRKNPPWAQHIAVAVARFTGCEVSQGWAYRPGSDSKIVDACLTFCGFNQDTQMAQWMYEYLVGVLINEAQAFRLPVFLSPGERRKPTKVEGNEFRRGFVAQICARLAAMSTDRDRDLLTSEPGRALVVAKKSAIEDRFGEFKYKENKGSDIRNERAFRAGLERGKAVDLNRRGIGSNGEQSSSPLLLGN